MYTNTVFGDTNSVLFIKVSSFQGVLLNVHMSTCELGHRVKSNGKQLHLFFFKRKN